MNKQTARSLLMDFLYDEISAGDKENLKIYLDNHPGMVQELKELRKTQTLLKQMPEVKAPQKLRMMEPRSRTFGQWRQDVKTILPHSGWGKAALAAAACLILLLVAGSVANVQITSDRSGFTLSLGYEEQIEQSLSQKPENQKYMAKQENKAADNLQPVNGVTEEEAEQFITTQEAETLLAKMQQQNKALLTAFAQQMNRQDEEQLQQIVKYFQAQRIYDLKRIKQSLNEVQLAGAYRWHQTNRVLGEIIQTASVKN